MQLAVSVKPGRVEMYLDGKRRFSIAETLPPGASLALRSYHDVSTSSAPPEQSWRNLQVWGADGRLLLASRLTGGEEIAKWVSAGAGWEAGSDGLRFLGTGELLVPAGLPPAFLVLAEIVHASDANIVLGSRVSASPLTGRLGLVEDGVGLILRPRYNDISWARIRGGHYQEFAAVEALDRLRARGQAVRLAGLAARLLAGSALLLAFCWTLGWILAVIWRRPLGPPVRLPPAWIWSVAGFCLAVLAWDLGFQRIPHVSDEISNLFQAKIFARNALAAPAPPMPDFFKVEHVLVTDKGWYSKYPPFWPWLLSWGVRFGGTWWVNPLFAALTLLVLARLGKEMGDRRSAWLATAWLATSPFLILMSASHFNHTSSLFFTMVFLLGVWRWASPDGRGGAILAATGLGGVALVRPFTAVCLAAPAFLWLFWQWPARLRLSRLWIAALVLASTMSLMLLSNWVTTGNPLLSAYLVFDRNDRPGFGPHHGSGWTWGTAGHNPAKGLRNMRFYLGDLSARLYGWPLGLSLAFIPLNFWLRRGGDRVDLFLVSVWLALVFGYFFYWGANLIVLGPRYWYESAGALALLSARGAVALADALVLAFGAAGRVALAALLAWLAGFGLFQYLPPQVWALRDFGAVRRSLHDTVEIVRPIQALVFVKIESFASYHEAFSMQDPWLQSDTIFVRDRGPENAALAALYPSRQTLLWDGERLTTLKLDGTRGEAREEREK